MPRSTVLEIDEWEVRVRVVPPTAMYRWSQSIEIDYPEKPPRPTARYDSIAGHVEEVPALPESAEYEAWLIEKAAYDLECAELDAQAANMAADFSYDYAIIEWRHKTWDENRWDTEPPDDWEEPGAFARHGVETSGNRRIEFIQNEILSREAHYTALNAAMYPDSDVERSTAPVREEEVSQAYRKFRLGDALSRAAGYLGGSARKGRTARRANEPIRK